MTAGKDQVNKAMKREKASGLYFPIAAVQVWCMGRHLLSAVLQAFLLRSSLNI